jgi:hypothetical protein
LPYVLIILDTDPDAAAIMTLRTLADVRRLIGHLPPATRAQETWRHLAAVLDDADRGGGFNDARDVAVALQLVLMLNRVPYRRK